MTSQAAVAIALGLLSMVGGGGVTWLVNRRKTSGRINTTEAETLWSESQRMRQELRDEVAALRAQMSEMRVENEHFGTQLALALAKNEELSQDLSRAEEKLDIYEREIDRLLKLLPSELRAQNEAIALHRIGVAVAKHEGKRRS